MCHFVPIKSKELLAGHWSSSTLNLTMFLTSCACSVPVVMPMSYLDTLLQLWFLSPSGTAWLILMRYFCAELSLLAHLLLLWMVAHWYDRFVPSKNFWGDHGSSVHVPGFSINNMLTSKFFLVSNNLKKKTGISHSPRSSNTLLTIYTVMSIHFFNY